MQTAAALLTLTPLDDAMAPLTVDVIRLQTWIPSIVQLFEERIHNQQQQLYILLMADLPPVPTNASALKQTLVELLRYACQHTLAGELITVSAYATDLAMEISVSSSGFRSSTHADSSTLDVFHLSTTNASRFYKDTELTAIQNLAKPLNASLLLESTESQTTFTLQLPYETGAKSNPDNDERIILASGISERFWS